MTDVRFVILRIGELSVKVDRLIEDVAKQGEKVSDVRDKITFVRGAIWVLGSLLGVVVLALGWYVTGHIKISIR